MNCYLRCGQGHRRTSPLSSCWRNGRDIHVSCRTRSWIWRLPIMVWLCREGIPETIGCTDFAIRKWGLYIFDEQYNISRTSAAVAGHNNECEFDLFICKMFIIAIIVINGIIVIICPSSSSRHVTLPIHLCAPWPMLSRKLCYQIVKFLKNLSLKVRITNFGILYFFYLRDSYLFVPFREEWKPNA